VKQQDIKKLTDGGIHTVEGLAHASKKVSAQAKQVALP